MARPRVWHTPLFGFQLSIRWELRIGYYIVLMNHVLFGCQLNRRWIACWVLGYSINFFWHWIFGVNGFIWQTCVETVRYKGNMSPHGNFYDPLHKGKDNWTCLNWWSVAMNVKNLRHKRFLAFLSLRMSSNAHLFENVWMEREEIPKVRILKLLKIHRMGRRILDVSFFTVSCEFISCHQYV